MPANPSEGLVVSAFRNVSVENKNVCRRWEVSVKWFVVQHFSPTHSINLSLDQTQMYAKKILFLINKQATFSQMKSACFLNPTLI